jgi:hypothetical protein
MEKFRRKCKRFVEIVTEGTVIIIDTLFGLLFPCFILFIIGAILWKLICSIG